MLGTGTNQTVQYFDVARCVAKRQRRLSGKDRNGVENVSHRMAQALGLHSYYMAQALGLHSYYYTVECMKIKINH